MRVGVSGVVAPWMGPGFGLQGLHGVVRDASSSDVQECRAYLGFRVEDEFAFFCNVDVQ